MFVHVFLAIYMFCHETELVKAAETLDFWDPLANYDRRTWEEKKDSHHLNRVSETVELKKTKPKAKRKDELHITTEGKNMKLKPISQHQNSHTQRSYHGRTEQEENTHWPKIQQRRFKTRGNKEEIRSTRMTPLYLMQVPGDNPDHSTAAPKKYQLYEKEAQVDLSPYSIRKQLRKLARELTDANITIEVLGRTVEYNDIVMLKVTERKSDIGKYFRADDSKYVDEIPEKKIVFIVHGLSVMGISNVPCLVSEKPFKILLSYYFAHLDKFDIFLIPMANPDGFVMSMRKELWNKNMSPQGACPGVSLDRNFDVAWNTTTVGSCSQHFPGATPFSEPETKAIRDVLHHYSHKIAAYFHVHSGSYDYNVFKGDAVLYPRGYTEVASDDDKYIDLRGEIDETIKNASFQVLSVTVDTLYSWYGKVSGSSVDYASSVYGIPYAMELVMQPFQDENMYAPISNEETYSMKALQEIWKRVIDVIFNTMWQRAKNGDNT